MLLTDHAGWVASYTRQRTCQSSFFSSATPLSFSADLWYVVVQGVAKLLDFLKQAFEAKEVHRPMMRPDGAIRHAEVRVGGSVVMMGEPMGEFTPMPGSLYVYVSDTDAIYKRALQAGATSLTEPADQFYGDRNASV